MSILEFWVVKAKGGNIHLWKKFRIQGYRQKMGVKILLYEIHTVCFILFMIPFQYTFCSTEFFLQLYIDHTSHFVYNNTMVNFCPYYQLIKIWDCIRWICMDPCRLEVISWLFNLIIIILFQGRIFTNFQLLGSVCWPAGPEITWPGDHVSGATHGHRHNSRRFSSCLQWYSYWCLWCRCR